MSFGNYSCEEEVNRLNKELIEMQKQLSESKVEYRRIENDFRNLQGTIDWSVNRSLLWNKKYLY